MHMSGRIRMKADQVGTGLGKRRRQRIDWADHQVNINWHGLTRCRFGVGLECLTNHRAEREVGHVMVIHDVKMNPVGAGRDHLTKLFTQAGEISRKNGRCNAKGF